jgi:magnesium chelatase subunit I
LLAAQITEAKKLYPQVTIEEPLLYEIASYCLEVGIDEHRGNIITM